MGRFDQRTFKVHVDVPGFDLERATKAFHASRAKREAAKREAVKLADAHVSATSLPSTTPEPQPITLGGAQEAPTSSDSEFRIEL